MDLVCCGVLQRFAKIKFVAACCSVLHSKYSYLHMWNGCVVLCCSMLQCIALCCFLSIRIYTCGTGVVYRVAACCSVLQGVAACCSVLHSEYWYLHV